METETHFPSMSGFARLVDSLDDAPTIVSEALRDPNGDADDADQLARDLVWLLRTVNEQFSLLCARSPQDGSLLHSATRIADAHMRLRPHARELHRTLGISIDRFLISDAYSAAASFGSADDCVVMAA